MFAPVHSRMLQMRHAAVSRFRKLRLGSDPSFCTARTLHTSSRRSTKGVGGTTSLQAPYPPPPQPPKRPPPAPHVAHSEQTRTHTPATTPVYTHTPPTGPGQMGTMPQEQGHMHRDGNVISSLLHKVVASTLSRLGHEGSHEVRLGPYFIDTVLPPQGEK
eukprot:GDKI01017956.1.p1 GENE.GDKI01017956.1~~GDKI01017956.1.p1  ORF type:complete len:185 (+),score=44.49 GDKI01017956.1:77-556(+)